MKCMKEIMLPRASHKFEFADLTLGAIIGQISKDWRRVATQWRSEIQGIATELGGHRRPWKNDGCCDDFATRYAFGPAAAPRDL
eukprot:COSAG01_NODE_16416_length_1237_cov_11.505272_1_plen_84_part_00